ncbi:MAG: InlB B-repeat-containing protein, partial [Candidatus Riflebacteria bacterium]|nr:InlB B-repeat-containing protein [Candidatus Riflebacteria bacterium]
MKQKFLFLFVLSLAAIAALIGCHAGGSAPFVSNNGETVVTPEIRTVGANGRFDDITFPSGALIKCPNDNTFQEGVKVTAVEEKVPVITDNSGTFSYIYVYNISAVLPSENSLTADVPVNTIEKPLSVSLPNDSTTGTCYIGTRASENDPWRYSLATDGINSSARFMRLASNPPKTCTFNLYRLNILFRLFLFDNEEKKDEVQVDTLTVAPAEDVEIKDDKYTGKLTVKMNIEGENLNSLKSEDLTAKITYRSENQQGANIDFITNKTDSSDKAVTGSYEHSFEISNIKVENSLGNTAELSFELNLDGVSLTDFPTDFIVEFYSKTENKDTLPFSYTQTFSFETKENQNDPDPQPGPDPEPQPQPIEAYSITYDYNGGALAEGETNPESYDVTSATITLKNPKRDGYDFTGWTGSNGDTPERVVKIEKGTTGDKSYTANYSAVAYTITYTLGADDVTNDN